MKGPTARIVVAADQYYGQHLGVMICSLLQNCSDPKRLWIDIFSDGITSGDLDKIRSLISSFEASSEVHDTQGLISITTDQKNHLSNTTYQRLLIPTMLPESAHRVCYLDSDMIIEGDILPLLAMDMDGMVAGVVEDDPRAKAASKVGVKNRYFNAGVLLINLDLWRKERISERTKQFAEENPDLVSFAADQDALNVLIGDRVHYLDRTWNSTPFMLSRKRTKDSPEGCLSRYPTIIHYSSASKPWHFANNHPFRDRYWHYLRQTQWKDYRCQDVNLKSIAKRLEQKLRNLRLRLSPSNHRDS